MTNTPDMSLQAETVGDRAKEMLTALVGPVFSDTALRVATDWLKQERRLATPSTVTEGTVPDDGWVMVPREPTEAMLSAVQEAFPRSAAWVFPKLWSVMVAASPKPTIVEASGMVERLDPATIERCAEVADDHVATGYMSGRERDYCHQHGDEIAEAIRSLSASSPSSEQGRG